MSDLPFLVSCFPLAAFCISFLVSPFFLFGDSGHRGGARRASAGAAGETCLYSPGWWIRSRLVHPTFSFWFSIRIPHSVILFRCQAQAYLDCRETLLEVIVDLLLRRVLFFQLSDPGVLFLDNLVQSLDGS